jgi:aspartate aminotransferase-like enzyme
MKNLKIISGASFCHVAKIMHEIHESDVITGGNQKCMGAIPSLSKIEAIKR